MPLTHTISAKTQKEHGFHLIFVIFKRPDSASCSDNLNNALDPTQCVQIGYMSDGYPLYGLCSTIADDMSSCWTARNSADSFSEYSVFSDDNYRFKGTRQCDSPLDKANGYTDADGNFVGYFLTDNLPYVPIGVWGTPTSTRCSFTPPS